MSFRDDEDRQLWEELGRMDAAVTPKPVLLILCPELRAFHQRGLRSKRKMNPRNTKIDHFDWGFPRGEK